MADASRQPRSADDDQSEDIGRLARALFAGMADLARDGEPVSDGKLEVSALMDAAARRGGEDAGDGFHENPYPFYAGLRESDPVHWNVARDAWLITRYADIDTVERGAGISFAARFDAAMQALPDTVRRRGATFERFMALHLGHLDQAEHLRVRPLFDETLTKNRVAGLRPAIRGIVRDRLTAMRGRAEFDLVNDFAASIPLRVMGTCLGLDEADHVHLADLSGALLGAIDHRLPDGAGLAEKDAAIAGLVAYFAPLLKQRLVHPQADLLGAIAAYLDTGRFTHDELVSACIQFLTGSYKSLRHQIGLSFHTLLQHDALEGYGNLDGDLPMTLIDETLRLDGMVQQLTRIATRPLDIGGRTIKPGDRIMLMPGAANRDPCQFADPDHLDPRRRPNRHLAFGLGAHYCPGAQLARTVLQISLSEIVRAAPGLTLDLARVEWTDSDKIRSIARFPALWRQARTDAGRVAP